jgi:fructose-specific phosphotransferase system component IIB
MSDFNSSLPVRTENDGDVVIKVADATTPSQQLKVEADGSINVNADITATDLDIRDLVFATDKVDVSGSEVSLDSATLAALENITVSATDLDIRDLAFATDSVDVSGSSVTVTATDLDIRDLAFATDSVDVSGSEVSLDAGTLAALENITVSATDLDIRDLAFATDKVDVSGSEVSLDAGTLAALENITVSATDLDIRDLAFATDSVDVSGSSVSITGDVNVTQGTDPWIVSATDLDIRDLTHASDSIKVGDGTDFLAVNSDGSINVVMQEDSGTETVRYNTAAAVAGGASSNHDYAFTAASKLYQVWASASGKLKIEVQIETGAATGVFNTIAVGFNSTSNPNIEFELSKYAAIPLGARVRVIRTNRDNQAQDVYSTIVGIDG